MNRCHKILQDIYFSLHKTFDDNIDLLEYTEDNSDILGNCVRQWSDPSAPLTFPAKSINVAVIYARLLEKHFRGRTEEYLEDADLFHGHDKYYRPFSGYSQEYKAMLDVITLDSIATNQNPSVAKTINYFNQEFMIDSCEYNLLTKARK